MESLRIIFGQIQTDINKSWCFNDELHEINKLDHDIVNLWVMREGISHLNDANNVENLNLFKALCLHEKCFDAGSLEISPSSNFVKYLLK